MYPDAKESLDDLAMKYILKNPDRTFSCSICGKIYGTNHNAKTHLEASHFPSATGYECQVCGLVLNTKNAHAVHMSKKHK